MPLLMRKNEQSKRGKLRIIGGKWRGRCFPVVEQVALRPTPDRVRETLFNWLMGALFGARCLDLFAGSGALGLEALSRGAKEVYFVEKDKIAMRALEHTLSTLEATAQAQTFLCDSRLWLQQHQHAAAFDIIFLDPPYQSDLLIQALTALKKSSLIGRATHIYIEAPLAIAPHTLPSTWHLLKQKRAANVVYHLVLGSNVE